MYEIRVLSADLKTQVIYHTKAYSWVSGSSVRLTGAKKTASANFAGRPLAGFQSTEEFAVVYVSGPAVEIRDLGE